jgi:endonuclease YncB( thermonuclease family)
LRLVAVVAAAGEGTLQGRATVIDGDTLEVAGERIDIFGIDAPEQDQTCGRGGGGTWNCGAEATRLMRWMAHYQIVDCLLSPAATPGRRVARCRVGDEDLGRAMVRAGFAVEVSRTGVYAAEEAPRGPDISASGAGASTTRAPGAPPTRSTWKTEQPQRPVSSHRVSRA